jgi:hypothetical protein
MKQDWHDDCPKPAYSLPLIVDAPEGKRNISDWAKDQVRFDYWLCFRRGTTEYNARCFFPLDELAKRFKHGDIFNGNQFIVEKL